MATTLRVKVRDRWFTVEVGALGPGPVTALVDGEPVEVDIEGLGEDVQPVHRGEPDQPEPTSGEVLTESPATPRRVFSSPMPGVIISVAVRVGDQVVTGDEVCVLEAMKMHQTLRADWSGIARAVHVQPGQRVSAGAPLVELE